MTPLNRAAPPDPAPPSPSENLPRRALRCQKKTRAMLPPGGAAAPASERRRDVRDMARELPRFSVRDQEMSPGEVFVQIPRFRPIANLRNAFASERVGRGRDSAAMPPCHRCHFDVHVKLTFRKFGPRARGPASFVFEAFSGLSIEDRFAFWSVRLVGRGSRGSRRHFGSLHLPANVAPALFLRGATGVHFAVTYFKSVIPT